MFIKIVVVKKEKDFKVENVNILREVNEDKMKFVRDGRIYYTTRAEAERARRKGQTIRYSERYNAYYIVTIRGNSFWGW